MAIFVPGAISGGLFDKKAQVKGGLAIIGYEHIYK